MSRAVSVREDSVVLPTYSPPPPDPNPMFLDRRVNQGTSGRVYPNPFTDKVANARTDRSYRAIFLENEYLQVMILPEIGGRIHAGLDKTNQYDFLYRQHVVKPALIGLFGSWISGGVECNWPQHHRPSTFMPVDTCIEEHTDGSRTAWLSEHEPMDRMKGMVGICLHPGQALIEMRVQLYNRTPLPQTFLWWVNMGIHVHNEYQVFFPPDVAVVTDHAKRSMSYFPIAKGPYYGVDYQGVDISWYKNLPVPSSYFAYESRYDFFGGYDHRRQAGVVHVANHHISPGKKMFTWGTADFARAWERNLTDADGPYIELMAGVYTDNQPDFSWLQPYETKIFSQFWYPIQQIGPAKKANRRAAVNLGVNDRKARIGVYAVEALPRAQVTLLARGQALYSRQTNLAPGKPFVHEVELEEGVSATDLVLQVHTAAGQPVIEYAPQVLPPSPLPDVATLPPPPSEVRSVEELYLIGLHLEQYRHPTIDPEPYWERALEIDSGDARSHNALGLVHLRRGNLAAAEGHFRRTIQTLTRRNPNPRDSEPYYNLGLTLQAQGRLDEAYASFYKAVWGYAWQAAGYYALAQIDCRRAELELALEHLDRSLLTNASHIQARNLRAAVLRRMGRLDEADALLHQTVAMDPLDLWSRNERVWLCRARKDVPAAEHHLQELARTIRVDAGLGRTQAYLDLAFDYADAGLWQEAADLLSRLVDRPDAPAYPMVGYALGHFAHQQGQEEEAREWYRRAAQMPPDYCFPVRLQEMAVLEHVLQVQPGDARAHYYLGNLLYDKRQYERAIQSWEAACRLEPRFSIPWRNLGIAYYNVHHDGQRALNSYLRAFEVNPDDARLLSELDQLSKRLQVPAAERLARLEAHLDLVGQRDDLSMEWATLHNQMGRPQKALDIVLARRFHPWEGGEGRVSDQYVAAHLALGRAALQAGEAATALAHFQAAQTYPDNLGEGRYPLAADAHLFYWIGLAQEMLGDGPGAQESFRQAARRKGELSADTYYQALALDKLGDTAEARARLEALLDYSTEQVEAASKAEFRTSVPQFVFYGEDPQRQRRIAYTYLIGLARLGLGEPAQAREAFEQVLDMDVNHLGALAELRWMAGR